MGAVKVKKKKVRDRVSKGELSARDHGNTESARKKRKDKEMEALEEGSLGRRGGMSGRGGLTNTHKQIKSTEKYEHKISIIID